MDNLKSDKKTERIATLKNVDASDKYANAPFFKKKDEEAIRFLKKHPVPPDFWKIQQ
jgi:hypothetical protein